MKKLFPIFLILAAAIAVVAWLQRAKEDTAGLFSGYAEGELVYVSSPIAGELQQLSVRRGDQIARDAFLFELEREAERAARSEAE